MSLATLNWRQLSSVIPASNAIKDVLDAVYTCMTATTYRNGNARTPGSGSAWTFSRYQNAGTTEAVYGTPVAAALNHRLILGGASGAKTPTMASPDTWATSTVLAGLAKNAGAYNAWDNAAPFTSGQFYGYWRAVASTVTVAKVWAMECQEAVVIVFETAAGLCFPIMCGAYLDPESSGAAAESDGRRYGLVTPHPTAGMAVANFLEGSGAWLGHATAATSYHHMVADVGAVSTFVTAQLAMISSGSTTTSMQDSAGNAVVFPLCIRRSSAAPNDNYLGVTRQFGITRNALSYARRVNSSSVEQWYTLAYSTASANNALGFKV